MGSGKARRLLQDFCTKVPDLGTFHLNCRTSEIPHLYVENVLTVNLGHGTGSQSWNFCMCIQTHIR
jgi:hypothetical protein